ncbi:hypothetical protein BH10ACT6_BH10ACT6_15240 [soil metagenome]
MDITGAGTAIMVAVAALLWFLYFVPTWMARREYLDTERTATRLQQTLRIMAETAEVPEQVRVEVTARDAARTERVLRAQQHRADVLATRAAASVRAATPAMPRTAASISWTRAEPSPALTLTRLRRRRAHRLASSLMIIATLTIGVQLVLVVATGLAPGAWLVFAAGAAFGVAGVTVRRRLGARSSPGAVASPRAAEPAVEQPRVAAQADAASGWTPVPVPPPLYLSRGETQPIVPVAPTGELMARLRSASLASEQAVRAAHAEPEVTPIRQSPPIATPAAAPAAPSRWAAMGRIGFGADGADAAAPDLDEVLRRRRNVG